MDRIRQQTPLRLADQQMDVLRHHDISIDTEDELAARVFQAVHKQIVELRSVEVGLPAMTTEGDEMRVSRLLETLQAARLWKKTTPGRVRSL